MGIRNPINYIGQLHARKEGKVGKEREGERKERGIERGNSEVERETERGRERERLRGV